MTLPIIKKTNKIERMFILAGLLIVGTIFASIIPLLFIQSTDSLSDLETLRISQIISQLFMFIIPPLLYAITVKGHPMSYLGFRKTSLPFLIIACAMMYAILPLNNIFAEWNAGLRLPDSMKMLEELMKALQDKATEVTEMMLNVNNIGGLIVNLFMIAGLAAFGEELLFRSILQPFLIKAVKNAHLGIFITAFVFSFIHFEFYGFLPRLILGLLLGYMFYLSKSIWVPMLMHFVNNGTAVVLYFLNNRGITNVDVDTFGQTKIAPLLISIFIMIALFWLAVRKSKEEHKLNNI